MVVDEKEGIYLGSQMRQELLEGEPGMLGFTTEPFGGVVALLATHRRTRAPIR